MRASILKTVARSVLATALAATLCAGPASAGWRKLYEVHGVDEGDMLKMRGGPGTGFDVIVGLPNGTLVRLRDCTQTGGTRWCKVALDRAPGLTGFVSWAYLQEH